MYSKEKCTLNRDVIGSRVNISHNFEHFMLNMFHLQLSIQNLLSPIKLSLTICVSYTDSKIRFL